MNDNDSCPLVSICIPTFNRPALLDRTLMSCLGQTYANFEVIVTDNSSNGDSRAIINGFPDKRVRYYKNKGNIGPAASAERALSKAVGKYAKCLMDDDLLKPRFLEKAVEALEKHPSCAVAMSPMELIDEDDRRITPRFYVFRRMDYRYRYQVGDGVVKGKTLLADFLTRDYPCSVPSAILILKSAFDQFRIPSAEAGTAGDLELCMKLATRWDFYYIDEVLSSWRCSPESDTIRNHHRGMDVEAFYHIAEEILGIIRGRFKRKDFKKLTRQSMFFCSCRALLNVLAGVRSGNAKLVADTVRTIMRRDRFVSNWCRLPLFVCAEALKSISARKLSPPR